MRMRIDHLTILMETDDEGTRHSKTDQVGEQTVEWSAVFFALRKRLHGRRRDSEDALQEALTFFWLEIEQHDTNIGLAIHRAASRVNKGQSITYEPQGRKERWESTMRACDRVDFWTISREGTKTPIPENMRDEFAELELTPPAPMSRSYRAPLQAEDYSGRPALISRQEFRMELQWSEDEIDAVYAACEPCDLISLL